jgi:hypothetical protein
MESVHPSAQETSPGASSASCGRIQDRKTSLDPSCFTAELRYPIIPFVSHLFRDSLGKIYEIEGLDIPEGTWVHFDVESNPLAERLESEVYLWGLHPPPHDRKSFEYCWNGGKGDQDKVAWLEFLDRVAGYRQAYPDLILVWPRFSEQFRLESPART